MVCSPGSLAQSSQFGKHIFESSPFIEKTIAKLIRDSVYFRLPGTHDDDPIQINDGKLLARVPVVLFVQRLRNRDLPTLCKFYPNRCQLVLSNLQVRDSRIDAIR